MWAFLSTLLASVPQLVKAVPMLDELDLSDPSALMVAMSTTVCAVLALAYLYQVSSASSTPTFLPLEDFTAVPLIRKDVLSHDTRRFTFALPSKEHRLGLPVGQHVSLKFTNPADNKTVQRSYTPVSEDLTTRGEFSLVIKVYKPLPPKFPNGGLLSQHLDSLKIGDTILMRGPKGHMHYHGQGKFEVKPLGKPLQHRASNHIGMMAGGTGITPMLQVLHEIFRKTNGVVQDSKTCVKMIYANQTPDDILVRTELEALAKEFPTRFQLWYTVDRLDEASKKDWAYDTGFITQDMVEQHLFFKNVPAKDQQVFMCGPPPMLKFACIPALTALGFTDKEWVTF